MAFMNVIGMRLLLFVSTVLCWFSCREMVYIFSMLLGYSFMVEKAATGDNGNAKKYSVTNLYKGFFVSCVFLLSCNYKLPWELPIALVVCVSGMIAIDRFVKKVDVLYLLRLVLGFLSVLIFLCEELIGIEESSYPFYNGDLLPFQLAFPILAGFLFMIDIKGAKKRGITDFLRNR